MTSLTLVLVRTLKGGRVTMVSVGVVCLEQMAFQANKLQNVIEVGA
jgi:hypothetical protein